MYSVVPTLYFLRPCPGLGVDSKYRIVSLLSLIILFCSVLIKFNLVEQVCNWSISLNLWLKKIIKS